MKRPDRWDVVEVLGAALLTGGVWAQWGAPWGALLLGTLLLPLATLRAALSLRQGG